MNHRTSQSASAVIGHPAGENASLLKAIGVWHLTGYFEFIYFNAAKRLFDISKKQADFLFTPCAYDGAKHGATGERYVAKRIRDFVAGKVAP